MVSSESEDDIDVPDGPGTTNIPPTIYVLKFHANTRREAVEWLLEKIEAKQKYGGAELFVRSEPQKQGQGVTVHISATKIKLLEVAEATELQKKNAEGLIQDFGVRELDHFLQGGQTLETILTSSEREFCVRHELDRIRAKPEESCIPGYQDIKLYPGQAIVDVYLREDLVTSLFPLHDRQALEDLNNRWYKSIFQGATIDEIRSYFGESVAIYFAFNEFYTLMLTVPAVLALLTVFMSVDSLATNAFFAAFHLVWVTVCLELWKRRGTELAYNWGTLTRIRPSRLRPTYQGDMTQNPITGRYEPYFPHWWTKSRVYFVSVPILVGCIFGALWLMIVAFYAEEQLIDWKRSYGSIAGIFAHFPSAVYAVVVWIVNFHFKKLAVLLTEWENHRTADEHQWHLMLKLVAFQMVNNFSSLFYIAFYIRDVEMLCSQVATLLIVTQMINQFKEVILPLKIKKAYNKGVHLVIEELKRHQWTKQFFVVRVKAVHLGELEEQAVPVLSLDQKDPRMKQAHEEESLETYQQEEFEAYLDTFIQFGYVFLFSSVYPMAAFWAVLNNVLELKTGAFKLCRVYQRPKTRKVRNIGVWQNAFELLGMVAVITNCALLCISPRVRVFAPLASNVEWILMFVALEHIIIVLKLTLIRYVSDTPSWVQYALDKVAFQQKLAYRNERGKKTRRHLSRRFRSVHGMPRSGSRSRGTTPVAQNGGLRHRTPPGRDYSNYRE